MTPTALLDQVQPSDTIYSDNLKRKFEDIKKFGIQSLSYSALQDGIREFRNPAFEGFIPYISAWGIDYVLSDPITPQEDFKAATLLFLNHSKDAVFCQISDTYAQRLTALNLTINGLGVEHVVNLDEFEVTWKKRKRLKSYLSSLSKQDFYVFENHATLNEVNKINEEWLKIKNKGRELRFMARPFVSLSEEDVRCFYLIKDKKILGFCSFDPIYSHHKDQKISSYGLQHLRVCQQAPSGAQDFLLLNAISQFKDEGFKRISLGISPLYQRENDHFNHSRFAEGIFSFLYRTSLLYNYRSMGEHKEQYKVQKNQTYLATKSNFSLRKLCGLLKVNNLI